MRSFIFLAALAGLLCAPTRARAGYVCGSPGPRGTPPQPCPRFNPENGHYYAYTLEYVSWEDAKTEAESYTFLDTLGHLATITTVEEEEFLFKLKPESGRFWIGASDAEVEGEWRWVVGPEAGELFWLGGVDGTALTYANWIDEAPNNNLTYGGQDHATSQYDGWNDAQDAYVAHSLIEFSVPEPSTLALAFIGVLGMVGVIWKRK